MLLDDRDAVPPELGGTDPAGRFGPPGELVRRLFESEVEPPEVTAAITAYIERFLGSARVGSELDDDALAARFHGSEIPAAPGPVLRYLERLRDTVLDHSINTSSPSYMGHMTSALPSFMQPLSRLVVALNQNVVKVETAKSLTPYEREAIAMIHRLVFGRDDAFYARHVQHRASTLGVVTSGGTVANLTALWIARNTALGQDGAFGGVERAGLAAALEHHRARRAVVIGSALMHYSLEKGADLLGIGTDALIRVPVDRDGRQRIDEVRRTLAACRARGDVVIAMVGVAGTTDTGAVDPLVELAAIAREAGIHFHVDAAWAGPILLSPGYRHKLAGIELADSVTIDGHKQLYLPMGVGMLTLRDPDAARVVEKQAQYIIRADSADLGRRSLEGSRPGMALYLHAALHILGASGYAWLLDEGIRKAAWMADRLRAHAELELLVEPQTNIVNYRYVPPPLRDKARRRSLGRDEQEAIGRLNQRLQERQKAEGTTFVSRTTLRHTAHGDDLPIVSLRAVLANPLTTESHIDRMLELQTQIATSLMA
jgi:putative pyridoxal-dependent aspartate 1-decarboxylase